MSNNSRFKGLNYLIGSAAVAASTLGLYGCNTSRLTQLDEQVKKLAENQQTYVSRDPTADARFSRGKTFETLTNEQRDLETRFASDVLRKVDRDLVYGERKKGDGLIFVSYNFDGVDATDVEKAYHLGLLNGQSFGEQFNIYGSVEETVNASKDVKTATDLEVLTLTDASATKTMLKTEKKGEVRKATYKPGTELVLVVESKDGKLGIRGLYHRNILEQVLENRNREIDYRDDLTNQNVFNESDKLLEVMKELGAGDVENRIGRRPAYIVEVEAAPQSTALALDYFEETGRVTHLKKLSIEKVWGEELDTKTLKPKEPKTKRGYWIKVGLDKTTKKPKISLEGDLTGW